jgi:hypothetical protein
LWARLIAQKERMSVEYNAIRAEMTNIALGLFSARREGDKCGCMGTGYCPIKKTAAKRKPGNGEHARKARGQNDAWATQVL